jgi:3-phenylpropionate/trans-cinnamate dioxygenase ferredoxin reductase subunit
VKDVEVIPIAEAAKCSIVIIGAGQAGAQAVETLRRQGHTGKLTLIGEEEELPYQRPPLSKAFLLGDMSTDRLLLKHRRFYEEHAVELKLGVRADHLDTSARQVRLSNGETLPYDRLLMCTGASSRRASFPGSELAGLHYLRGVQDVRRIKPLMTAGARIVIIGGGYIGLEVAASARKLGCQVTVLEMTDRPMSRVVASSVSEYFASEHRSHGVKILCGMRVIRVEGSARVERVVCVDGSSFEADALIIGVGAIPNTEPAESAGISCENGIVVDEYCRTNDPFIYAAGDCSYHPSIRFDARVRLECVDNAFEQAKAAALNMLGQQHVYDRVPWFWSDQYDNKLLITGLSFGHDLQIDRGDPATRCFSICYLKGGELIAVEAVNNVKDHMAARILIAQRAKMDIDKLADFRVPLKSTCV